MYTHKVYLNTLWNSACSTSPTFQLDRIVDLPSSVQRYLEHAIVKPLLKEQASLAAAVRLKMHGQIKLKGWQSFQAEQIICFGQGMLWQATVWMNGLPIFGWDRLIDRKGAMQWKLLGLFPVMKASDADVTRSAVGRMQGEYIWLPSAFLHSDVKWSVPTKDTNNNLVCAELTLLDETTHLNLTVDPSGQLKTACFQRWGDPDGGKPNYENFGVVVEAERTFSGYTIPSQIRAGWYFGSNRFESEGEFFRATIDRAIYR